MNSFLFYDYETFGTSPSRDRIAQFAAIRTDEDFNIIESPINILCKQYDDYIPSPEAILITKITPEICNQNGLHERDFAEKIHQAFSQPNTCVLGYNSIRFDDEMTRYLFYRNFYDPYAYTWMNGNSRWDLIDLVRATFALRPEGIQWPIIDGKQSFKLEHLSQANHLDHSHAHDALSDVYATIGMAKLIKTVQPKLFDYFFQRRRTNMLIPFIEENLFKPIVHISGMFGESRGNMSIVSPIAFHPWNKNAVICIDLMGAIDEIICYEADDIESRLYTATADLEENRARVPIKLVHLNKCPIIAPLNTLKEVKNLHGTDPEFALMQLSKITSSYESIRTKMLTIFNKKSNFDRPNRPIIQDVESMLYDGFFSKNDKNIIETIPSSSATTLQRTSFSFEDARLSPLLLLYRAKNFPETLSDSEKIQWKNYAEYRKKEHRDEYAPIFDQLMNQYHDNTEVTKLLNSCSHFYA